MAMMFQTSGTCRRHASKIIPSNYFSILTTRHYNNNMMVSVTHNQSPLRSSLFPSSCRPYSPNKNNNNFILIRHQSTNQKQSPFEQPTVYDNEFERQRMRRNTHITMHPDGIGKDILPGNYVVKFDKAGLERKVILEHEKGYFWALKVRHNDNDV